MAECIHHPELEGSPCVSCGRPFCERCLVSIVGRPLCEDCKAHVVQGMAHGSAERKTQHPMAIFALLVPIIGYMACGLLVPITGPIGLYMGQRVLRELRTKPHYTGRTVALAAMVVSGGTLATWILALVSTLVVQYGGRH